MSDDGKKNASRMAELAYEIMGAQMTQKLLTEMWDLASPEAKQAVADQILKIALVQLTQSSDLRYLVKNEIDRRIDKVVSEWDEKIKSEVHQIIAQEFTPEKMRDAVVRVARQVLDTAAARSVESVIQDLKYNQLQRR